MTDAPPKPLTCVVCGQQHVTDVTKWVTVLDDDDGIQFVPGIMLGEYRHLCGAACAVKCLSNWLHEKWMEVTA